MKEIAGKNIDLEIFNISQIVAKIISSIHFIFCLQRFHDDDDDLADMESNFRQIEREELKR